MSNITITQLIDEDPRYQSLKDKVFKNHRGSHAFFESLYSDIVLAKHSDYKKYLKAQSIAVPGTKRKGYSSVYRSNLSPKHLINAVDDSLKTGYEIFIRSAEMYKNNDCLGERVYDESTGTWSNYYVWESYHQVRTRAQNFGAGILSVVNAIREKPLDTNDFIVSILSVNRKEWVLTDLACQTFALPNTALYTTLGEETSEYILNLTESPVLVLQSSNLLKVFSYLNKLKHLKVLVVMEDLAESDIKQLNENFLSNVKLFTMKQVEQIGSLLGIAPIPPTPQSLYTISFTSGTTGMPKGVELTHEHLASSVAFAKSIFDINSSLHTNSARKQAYELSFLPLAHILQREISAFSLSSGVGSGFMHISDPNYLVDCLRVLKPNFMTVVPRILTKMESGIKNSLNSDEMSTIAKNIASNILDAKLSRFQNRGGPDDSLVNSLVYHKFLINKIRSQLGFDNLEYMVIGSAPVSNETLLFMRSCLDIGIKQGYGLTETFAGFCIAETYERDIGSCGAPGIGCEVRLKSVPEMGYDAEKELKGEIQTRGPQSIQRYFKNPDATKAAIDNEGWFSTGDVGFIDHKGRIHIIDRVKNFFKLAQGEYIAPEKVENTYLSSCPEIIQAFVTGNSLETFLVGIIGIEPIAMIETLHKHLGKHCKFGDPNELVSKINSDKNLRAKVIRILNAQAKGLQGFEKLHNIRVAIEPMKIEEDLITPSFKVKRSNCTKYFQKQVKEMYAEGSMIKSSKL